MSLFASWVEPPPPTEKVNYACHHTMGSYFHVSSEEAEIKEWKKEKRMSPLKKKKELYHIAEQVKSKHVK